MNWTALTHGVNGLVLAYALALLAMLVTLAQRRAAVHQILLSAVLAIPTAILGVAVGSAAGYAMTVHSPAAGPWPARLVGLGAVLFAGVLGGIWFTRSQGPREAHKRGTVIEPGGKLKRTRVGAVTLAGIEIPTSDETKHFKLLGTTGSGKSTAIRELLAGALERGDRAIIADPDGGYRARFYDRHRGDMILNPFEKDSARWDLFGEIEQPYDIDQLARSLISDGADPSSREWRAYARTFLGALIEYCKLEDRQDLPELWRLAAVADVDELQPILAGSAAQPFLADGAAKMFHSIRGTASPALAALKHIKNQRTTPFAIRRWIRKGKGVLFLPYQAGQIAALRDLISTWLRLAIFETMAQGEGDHRLWFVIDELDALGQIDGLKDALARLRKFGGRCVLGFQSIAQVRGTYGDAEAQTIVENCGNTLILRCSASERGGTAEFASRLIGQREVVRREVSHSRPTRLGGAVHQTRSVSDHHVTEDAVMASEIEQLPDLQGYLKLASSPSWRRVLI